MGRASGQTQTVPISRRGRSLPLGLVPASAGDYARFLAAYLKAGGKLNGYHDSFEEEREFFENWFVACKDFRLPPLCGADSVNVIVPEEVTVLPGDRGHSRLYQIGNPQDDSVFGVRAYGDLPLSDAASGYLLEQLEQAVQEAKRDHEQLMQEIDADDRRFEQQFQAAKKFFAANTLPDLRPATTEDYQRWLNGYKANGGEITTVYNYPLRTDRFYVALRDFTLPEEGLVGANYVSIIIPANVHLLGGDVGHCDLFYMDGFKTADRGACFVPGYTDAH